MASFYEKDIYYKLYHSSLEDLEENLNNFLVFKKLKAKQNKDNENVNTI